MRSLSPDQLWDEAWGPRQVGSLLSGCTTGLLHHVGFTLAIAEHEKPELTARLDG
jgi:hypothetical protein